MSIKNEILKLFLLQQKNTLSDSDISRSLISRGIECYTDSLRKEILSISSLFRLQSLKDGSLQIILEPKIQICTDFFLSQCKPNQCGRLHICRFAPNCTRGGRCTFPHALTTSPHNLAIIQQTNYEILDQDLLIQLLRCAQFGEKPRVELTNDDNDTPPQQNHPNTSRPFQRGDGRSRGRSRKAFQSQIFTNTRHEPYQNKREVFSNQRRSGRSTTRGGSGHVQSFYRPSSQNDDSPQYLPKNMRIIDNQVDVMLPGENEAPQVDREIVELLLVNKDHRIREVFNETNDDDFRHFTIEFESKDSVDKLLAHPFLTHGNIQIKMKRTLQSIDKHRFILKIRTDKKIDSIKLELYIDTLIKNRKRIITDMTNEEESGQEFDQISLIQCDEEIDFEKLREAHSMKKQLQNKNVMIGEVYELQKIKIKLKEQNNKQEENVFTVMQPKQFTFNILKHIFSSLWSDVFSWTIKQKTAVIDLVNSNALERWLSRSDEYEKQFGISIRPIFAFVEKDLGDVVDTHSVVLTELSENLAKTTITPSVVATSSDEQPYINLKPEWTLILCHPTFQVQYKEYLKASIGFDVQINGSMVALINAPLNTSNRQVLYNRTNTFMQGFVFKQLNRPSMANIHLLNANSHRIAFQRIPDKNAYSLASNYDTMNELFPYLCSRLIPERITERPLPQQQQQQQHQQLSSPDTAQFLSPIISNVKTVEKRSLPVPHQPLLESIQYPIDAQSHVQFFLMKSFEERFSNYLQGAYNVKSSIESNIGKDANDKQQQQKNYRIIIKIIGEINDVSSARTAIDGLFSSLETKVFSEKTVGTWTKIADSAHVIQHHMNSKNVLCCCTYSKNSLIIHYFNQKNAQFGVDKSQIDEIINGTFLSATTSYQSLLSSSKLKEKWQDCEKKIRNRPDYNQQICLLSEEKSIYLFGLPAIVKELHATFEKLKTEHETKLFKLTLNQNQIKYLLNVCSSDLKALDEKHKMDGVEIMSKLKNSEILAPINMFENLKLRILEYAQITTSTFDICEPGFASLIQNQKSIIIDKARECRCYVTTKIETTQVQVKVPKAHTVDNNDNEQKIQGGACASAIPTSSSQLVTSVNINMGVIRVCLDDLTTRKDDVIVVNLTSEVLKNAVLKAAGQQVSDELVNFVNNYQTTNLIETSPGLLACKKIIFLQWSPQAKDVNLFQSNKQSISDFVSEAITYAFKNKYKSIAFPAIGCGKFGIKPDIIGEAMISEAERQLIKYPKDNFSVSFVLLPQQQSVYDEFCKQLNLIKSANFSLIPTNLNSGNVSRSHITMPFEQQIVKITLISSTEEHIIRCYNSLLELSKKCTLKLKLSNKQDLKDWTQSTVDKYYKYCLDRKIEPILDISNGVLELNGPKDDVDQAEKYYYELVTETLKQAHKHVLSRGIIWSVELTPNDGQWEQYSYKMNAEIEDAYQRKSPYIDLQNESKEQVRIKFDKNQMCEESSKTTRNIQRKVINQNLPDNWETSDVNCKRVQLKTGSPEYAKVLNLFDVTMRGNYVQIVKIERIQNERWFKQYAAHRDEFNLRNKQNNAINNNEKLLFHGCLDTTADKIVQECFNRSFAGVNGIAYGWGVYFATSALYSHAFAKPNARGERTTFLARVLIGNTMVGDPSIKVPPTGWDTTTSKDQGIFVVYHDAQSYADYLITYK